MSPYLIAALLGAGAALFGAARRGPFLVVSGTLLSFALLGYSLYLAIATSIGTGALALVAGIAASTVGVAVTKTLGPRQPRVDFAALDSILATAKVGKWRELAMKQLADTGYRPGTEPKSIELGLTACVIVDWARPGTLERLPAAAAIDKARFMSIALAVYGALCLLERTPLDDGVGACPLAFMKFGSIEERDEWISRFGRTFMHLKNDLGDAAEEALGRMNLEPDRASLERISNLFVVLDKVLGDAPAMARVDHQPSHQLPTA